MFYIEVFLQNVVGNLSRKHLDVVIISALYVEPSDTFIQIT